MHVTPAQDMFGSGVFAHLSLLLLLLLPWLIFLLPSRFWPQACKAAADSNTRNCFIVICGGGGIVMSNAHAVLQELARRTIQHQQHLLMTRPVHRIGNMPPVVYCHSEFLNTSCACAAAALFAGDVQAHARQRACSKWLTSFSMCVALGWQFVTASTTAALNASFSKASPPPSS